MTTLLYQTFPCMPALMYAEHLVHEIVAWKRDLLLTSCNTLELGQPPVQRRLPTLESCSHARSFTALLTVVAKTAGHSLHG